MKKFTVLVALALLAATGTSYAVTCAYDNVPGATLLVPYFKVANTAGTSLSAGIQPGGANTLVAITNVSQWGAIAHVTVWNKQSAAVLDFNVPMTGYDVATFNMRDILNGFLNVNPTLQKPATTDICQNLTKYLGDTQTRFIRFTNPEYGIVGGDFDMSIGYYDSPAFTGLFRQKVWLSLDEGADVFSLTTRPSNDSKNPVCGTANTGTPAGDFTGYLTIDVVNYCTNYFPDESAFYTNDAIATVGWDLNGGSNVLMGDVFYIDSNTSANISGDTAVALEFDSRLNWVTERTFYARYTVDSSSGAIADAAGPYARFSFIGDGREPLGVAYGFRFLDKAGAASSTLTVWRSDVWDGGTGAGHNLVNLCNIADNTIPVFIATRDEDENMNETQITPGPSGGDPVSSNPPYIWWESQRIILTDNTDFNPAGYDFGWSAIQFPPQVAVAQGGVRPYMSQFNQAYIGVEHTAPGQFVSVGHHATLLDNQFTCMPGQAITEPANIPVAVTE